MWPHGRRALRLLGLAVLVLIIVITFLLYPLYGGYYLASPAGSVTGGPVFRLSEEDVHAHPALYALLVEKKKVRRPSPFPTSWTMWQDESVMDGWSAHVLTRLEDQALLRMTAPAVLEYEGAYLSVSVVRG
ncbi:hypothetical protein J2129_001845 [Methanofollis sp. W23]|uniref:hypothetical protein n=1 Tax=Methanofollis sp. W23 TaxID=2817849 RepID=UPI001AE266A2|nr:hypothetical protein [Methanofollis sp. W23]MBP2146391.1 hypothetical protein [Methanofollis sp. W23]